MALDIVVVPVYDTRKIDVFDHSKYAAPPIEPTLEVHIPCQEKIVIDFVPNEHNILTSEVLGLTPVGAPIAPLPDGYYHLKYTIYPPLQNIVEYNFMRVDKLMEKFDSVFLSLDMMECDQKIKKQSKAELDTIYYFIQGSIAAANNCAEIEANKLYDKANSMLDKMIAKNCGCSGNNYIMGIY